MGSVQRTYLLPCFTLFLIGGVVHALAVLLVDGVALVHVDGGEALGALGQVDGRAFLLVPDVVRGVVLSVAFLVLEKCGMLFFSFEFLGVVRCVR